MTVARITARQAEALELRRRALDYREIGRQMGVSHTQAWRLVSKALERVEAEDLTAVRALEIERLDALLNAVWPDAMEGDEKAVQRALGIMDRRAKLQGLDAPKKVEEEHTLSMELTAPDLDGAIAAALERRGMASGDVVDAEVVEDAERRELPSQASNS